MAKLDEHPVESNETLGPVSLPDEVYSVPEGDWVVLSSDGRRVVAHNSDLCGALEEAKAKGEMNGSVMRAVGLLSHWVI